MHIDEYRHGRMVIDGQVETKDLIIVGGEVHRRWWRREGHAVTSDDLGTVWEHRPRLLILGTGTSGRMQPTPVLIADAARAGIDLEVMTTAEAVARFNELSGDEELAAAFHLTC